MPTARPHLTILTCAAFTLCSTAPAQNGCDPSWADGFAGGGVNRPTDPQVNAIQMWDPDGPGPKPPLMIVGGFFSSAGSVHASGIAAWDGAAWSSLTGGVDGSVYALGVLPDGRLIAGGSFHTAGTTTARNVAVWNGSTWSNLGGGLFSGSVFSFAIFPDGRLYAGGNFSNVNRVARWDGSQWLSVGGGVNGPVNAVAAMPNGDLIVGGSFTLAGASTLAYNIARWNGSAWSAMVTVDLGNGVNNGVNGMCVAPSGDLLVVGSFTSAGGFPSGRIARWDGAWHPVGTGFNNAATGIAALPSGEIFAGGRFTLADDAPASRIARWDGAHWLPMAGGVDNVVETISSIGPGRIAVGGRFLSADARPAGCLALWQMPAPATIDAQPLPLTVCPSAQATFTTSASGSGPLAYSWQLERSPGDWADLAGDVALPCGWATATGADTAELHIGRTGCTSTDAASCRLRCIVSNQCGPATTDPATFTICPADYDCSGFVDCDDFQSFLAAFIDGADAADFDGTGFVDTDDFTVFVLGFTAGC